MKPTSLLKRAFWMIGLVSFCSGLGAAAQASTNWMCGAGPSIVGMFRVQFNSDGSNASFSLLRSLYPGAKPAVTQLTGAQVSDTSNGVDFQSREISLNIDTTTQKPYVGYQAHLTSFNIPGVGPKTTSELESHVWYCKSR